jgi:hypothetical protein
MIDFLTTGVSHLQDCLNRLGALWIVYFPLNFFVAAIVSHLTYPVMLRIDDKLLKQILQINALHGNDPTKKSKHINRWFVKYALTTGFAASALIALQFKSLSIETAIIYGLIGPYALTRRIVDAVGDKVEAEINQSISKTVQSKDLEYDKSVNEVGAALKLELLGSTRPRGEEVNAH